MKNWRPISLLCVNYKIITKTIANRLKNVLSTLVNKDRTCSVPGRNIYSNIFLFRDIIQYSEDKKIKSFLLTFDQEKAFDKVDREFMFKILEKMNFDKKFIDIIKTIYIDNKCRIINNGFLYTFFKIERGVRQRCPVLLPLYCLYAKALSSTLLEDEHIEGFPVPGTKGKKISQYADDLKMMITNILSLTPIFETLKTFELATECTINKNKKSSGNGRFQSQFL